MLRSPPVSRALIVHRSEVALGELRDILRGRVECDLARGSAEAIGRFADADYDVVVLDHRPPDSDATEMLRATAAAAPDAIVILMTPGREAAERIEEQADARVFRFLGGPDQRWQLPGIVAEGLRLRRIERERRELVQKLSADHARLQRREKLLDAVVRERTKDLEAAYVDLKAANRQALLGLAQAIEAKDPYTKGHCARVAEHTLTLAAACGYPAEEMENLEYASFLHDIGKIGIKDAVLLKPSALEPCEWEHMRQHPVVGDAIASQIEMLKPMRPAIRNHHERWDGTGYPDGMKGHDIPLAARIVCIADAFDAMITDRPYKRAIPYPECLNFLRRGAGRQFDPELVEFFCRERIGEGLD